MKSSAKKGKKFIAVVQDDHLEMINDIADKMKEEGVKIDQVLTITGIITGSAADLQKVIDVAGVKSVEEDKEKRAW